MEQFKIVNDKVLAGQIVQMVGRDDQGGGPEEFDIMEYDGERVINYTERSVSVSTDTHELTYWETKKGLFVHIDKYAHFQLYLDAEEEVYRQYIDFDPRKIDNDFRKEVAAHYHEYAQRVGYNF